jgi:hypothetical protein
MLDRPQKITFAEMRESGVRGLLVYCTDYRCSHSLELGIEVVETADAVGQVMDKFG